MLKHKINEDGEMSLGKKSIKNEVIQLSDFFWEKSKTTNRPFPHENLFLSSIHTKLTVQQQSNKQGNIHVTSRRVTNHTNEPVSR